MSAGDLTTLASVKAWLALGSQDTGASDALLSALIASASQFVKSYLNRDLLSQSYTEVYDGGSGSTLMVKQGPITAVASVAFAGQTIANPADPVSLTSGILFNGRKITLIGSTFAYGCPVVVSYTAGFITLPADLSQAVNELVGEAFKRRDHIGQTSKTLGGQETVGFSQADMNASIKTALNQYAFRI